MEGIVSLPTRLSQIALKLVTMENDNKSSDQTPRMINQKKNKSGKETMVEKKIREISPN